MDAWHILHITVKKMYDLKPISCNSLKLHNTIWFMTLEYICKWKIMIETCWILMHSVRSAAPHLSPCKSFLMVLALFEAKCQKSYIKRNSSRFFIQFLLAKLAIYLMLNVICILNWREILSTPINLIWFLPYFLVWV